MALPKDYPGQRCSLSRALEVIGERWTLLIMRDAFFGVRRFGDFAAHLGVPRAVLTARLEGLREAGLLAETPRRRPGQQDAHHRAPPTRTHSRPLTTVLLCLWRGRQRRHRFRRGAGQEFA